MIDVFIDTNVLLYAASVDPAERIKAMAARELIRPGGFGISVQVLQEFYVNASGKLAAKIPQANLDDILRRLERRNVVPTTPELFDVAVRLSKKYQISYWDAAIIAAAKQLGAKTIYSEDLSHGQEYEGIKVVNPFAA